MGESVHPIFRKQICSTKILEVLLRSEAELKTNPTNSDSSHIINGGLKHWKTLNVIFCSLILQLKVKVKITQVCPILCDPMNYSPPGSSVHGILQARRLEWVAMPSSRGIFQTQGLNLGLLQSEPSGKGGQLNLICNEELKLIRKREREKKKPDSWHP